jgi:hypothetical protein
MTAGNAETPIRVTGGASFPAVFGTLTVSIPLAVAVADSQGVHIDVRFRLLKRALRRFVVDDGSLSSAWWTARWDESMAVEFGHRSLSFRAPGRRGCRFVTMRRRKILPLVERLQMNGIPVTPVSTTIGWFFRRST